ncbi:MAG: 7TM diverse intracellular signaling domain-containing protein, partial [Campylobacterota bacterium]|nr:7TM diverse intracellular signaling domain-containing protein [Campylobacterota bacterium]
SKSFKKLSTQHVNYGFNSGVSLWIKFKLTNNTSLAKEQVLVLNNPLLERITLYDEHNNTSVSGMLHVNKERHHINPSFPITLLANSSQDYYLHVSNTTTALQFSLTLNDRESFRSDDKKKQFFITLFIGIISAFLIYALALFFYTKDTSYFYYTIYIAALVFQQLTYIGFLPLYMPTSFSYIDNLMVVPKVGIMIITAAIFAQSFLKTSLFKTIDSIYRFIIYAVVLQILFFATPWFYYPEVIILTGLVFIFYNLYAGIYVYKKGNKQARFFIAGWSFLVVGYFFSIIDALGLYSVMYHLPSLVLACTIFEALFLLLAFVDKLSIVQEQKEQTEQLLYKELQERNKIVENEVTQRTKALKDLYKELHHRVKNNLQIILSIIRLQRDRISEKTVQNQFSEIENRINSIAKTHELLYQDERGENINMHGYIHSLCEDIRASVCKKICYFNIEAKLDMPLREAVYIGLIINELIANVIKYSQTSDTITIVLLQKESEMFLHVSDNGTDYAEKESSKNSLGLKLVYALVYDQLSGSITKSQSNYDIRFQL